MKVQVFLLALFAVLVAGQAKPAQPDTPEMKAFKARTAKCMDGLRKYCPQCFTKALPQGDVPCFRKCIEVPGKIELITKSGCETTKCMMTIDKACPNCKALKGQLSWVCRMDCADRKLIKGKSLCGNSWDFFKRTFMAPEAKKVAAKRKPVKKN